MVKTIFITEFSEELSDIVAFENSNRKFSSFIDLISIKDYEYSEQFSSKMYFLQNQNRIRPQI